MNNYCVCGITYMEDFAIFNFQNATLDDANSKPTEIVVMKTSKEIWQVAF